MQVKKKINLQLLISRVVNHFFFWFVGAVAGMTDIFREFLFLGWTAFGGPLVFVPQTLSHPCPPIPG